MLPNLEPIAAIFLLNTRLLHNCLTGVDDERATRRLTPASNSLGFIAAHLADARYYVCGQAGRSIPNPLAGALHRGKTLARCHVIREAWDTVSTQLLKVCEELSAEDVARDSGPRT